VALWVVASQGALTAVASAKAGVAAAAVVMDVVDVAAADAPRTR